MCELFALSAHIPTTVRLSLQTFAERGGHTGPHSDGWGIACYEPTPPHGHPDALIIRDIEAASNSQWVSFVADAGLGGHTVLSHIRKATVGAVRLANTQPFRRELGGAVHVFAHNGDLDMATLDADSSFHPIGETDSEQAFCLLMCRMKAIWQTSTRPTLKARSDVFQTFCKDVRDFGIGNFLYSDGDALFAHGHKRTQADKEVRPPGLHVLERTCPSDPDALAGVYLQSSDPQQVILFASVPLSPEAWRPLNEGEIIVARGGVIERL